jgi:GntR family transcriptional regulator
LQGVIDFHIERSGVPPYLQIVQQVKQALRLGWLEPGDKLPTVHEVAASAAVNSNTVLKAYKELEREGLATGRPGQGTYIVKSLSQLSAASYSILRRRLASWIAAARRAGLDDDGIGDLFTATLAERGKAEIA